MLAQCWSWSHFVKHNCIGPFSEELATVVPASGSFAPSQLSVRGREISSLRKGIKHGHNVSYKAHYHEIDLIKTDNKLFN